jgi:hypothetical protein
MYRSIPTHILDLDSWEDLVLKVCDVSKDEKVLVQWLDDSLSLHDLIICEEKCPKKVNCLLISVDHLLRMVQFH